MKIAVFRRGHFEVVCIFQHSIVAQFESSSKCHLLEPLRLQHLAVSECSVVGCRRWCEAVVFREVSKPYEHPEMLTCANLFGKRIFSTNIVVSPVGPPLRRMQNDLSASLFGRVNQQGCKFCTLKYEWPSSHGQNNRQFCKRTVRVYHLWNLNRDSP